MVATDFGHGGATWAVLQYVLGLRRLGHDVCLIEPVKPAKCSPPGAGLVESDNATYFKNVVAGFGLEKVAALLDPTTKQTVGLEYSELIDFARRTDVLINISGMLELPELCDRIPIRVFLDLDPAFVQIWCANYGIDLGLARHTHFVTVGSAIGTAACPVPTCGLEWITTLQPVVLECWPVNTAPPRYGWTTVASWRGYGSVEHQGDFYGQKAHAWRELMTLPRRSTERFEPALGIHPDEVKDLSLLRESGWSVIDPKQVAGTPSRYREFIGASKAEIGIAKSGYVASRCGWFSDRSACYLASGRPVLAQETGFSSFIRTGEGLLAFSSVDQAAAGIDAINRDYAHHCRVARDLVIEYFDSDRVLQKLLNRLGA